MQFVIDHKCLSILNSFRIDARRKVKKLKTENTKKKQQRKLKQLGFNINTTSQINMFLRVRVEYSE